MTKTIAQLKENIYRLYQDMCDEGVFVEEEAPSAQAMMKLVQQAAREYLDYQDSCPRKWSDDEKYVLTYVKNVICALYTDSVSLENEEDENEEEEWNLTPAQYLKELKEHAQGSSEFAFDFDMANGYKALLILQNAIENGYNIDTNVYPQTPLQSAVLHTSIYKTKLLLESGADVDAVSSSGKTALCYALEYDTDEDVEILSMVLEANPKMDSIDAEGHSAVEYAVMKDAFDGLKLLVQKGAKVEGTIEVHEDAKRAIESELDAEIIPERLDIVPYSMLTHKIDIFNYLLEQNAPVDVPDANGMTALMYASISNEHIASLKKLIRAYGDVNKQNHEGQTPLMIAVLNNNYSAFRTLLLTGAVDISLKDNKGRTITDIIKEEDIDLRSPYPFKERLDEYKRQQRTAKMVRKKIATTKPQTPSTDGENQRN